MAETTNKFAGLFSNSRTRILIIIAAILLIIGLIFAISAIMNRMNGPLGPATSASVNQTPGIESVVGGWDKPVSAEYAKNQEQYNREQVDKAKKEGTSAVPSLIRSSNITAQTDLDPSKISGGVGFTDLKRLENADPSDLKMIAAKCASVGTLTYDTQGNATGTVAANGIVKDPCGRTMGSVGDDCNIRDANGKIIGKSSKTGLGTAVYDPQGKLIGTVGPDGQVRDLQGNVVAKVDVNGVVRDLNGQVVATNNSSAKDQLVYDDTGKIIGVAGPDGTIRDAAGNLVGIVDANGIAKSTTGEIIGKVGSATAKSLVYDKAGKLLGVVGADGKVRDATGKIVGTVAADGSMKDLKGVIIGKASANAAGAPVYDSAGRIVSSVGPDGVVRDAQGNNIGTAQPDGTVVNAKGEVIGKAGISATGVSVTDEQDNTIGTAGPDGLVRDAKGIIIGKIDPATGTVVNNQGKAIGKISAGALAAKTTMNNATQGNIPAAQGTPVYDKASKLIGTAEPDGVVRDAKGNAIGKVDPLTSATLDASGKVLGNFAPKAVTANDPSNRNGAAGKEVVRIPSLGGNEASQAESNLLKTFMRQNDLANDQQLQADRQQLQSSMAAQAAQLFTSWAPPTQQFVAGNPPTKDETKFGLAAATARSNAASPAALIKAGTIMFAVLDTAINTDQIGPIMATVVGGKYKGAKLLGTVTRQTDRALLNFNIMNADQFSKTIAINAVAIDPNTARTALSTNVDYHYLLRYGTLFASAFIQGYANAVMTSGTQITSNLLATYKSTPVLTPKDKFLTALGQVGTQYSALLTPLFNTPPTVTIDSGTGVGILFLTDLAPQT